MAQIEPFRAIRYARPDISDLVAPPYDILSESDKQALLAKDSHNIVAIDLPHTPPKSAGPNRLYDQAAGALTQWLDVQTLVWDEQPALYAYHQTYSLGGRTLTRKKFFARLRLEPFGSGTVFPHEQTFGGPKEDRLKLTVATRCNLSPIFVLYPDPANEVSAAVEADIDREPDQRASLDGVQNKLWAITDASTIDQVRELLSTKAVFIADGHHRYGTALNYRQKVVEEMGEPLPGDPVNFVLAVLGGMEDPGATIRPYFRSMTGLARPTGEALRADLSDAFTWSPTSLPAGQEELAESLAAAGPQAFALYAPGDETCGIVVPKDADLLARYEPNRTAAWRHSAYSILHRYVIDEVLAASAAANGGPTVHYHKTMEEAVEAARRGVSETGGGGVAALMPATTMTQLRDICTAGELMPQKSTYFYPKLATGMVINPLYD